MRAHPLRDADTSAAGAAAGNSRPGEESRPDRAPGQALCLVSGVAVASGSVMPGRERGCSRALEPAFGRGASGRAPAAVAARQAGTGFRSGPSDRHPELPRLGRTLPAESSPCSAQTPDTGARRRPPHGRSRFSSRSMQVSSGTLKSSKVVGTWYLLAKSSNSFRSCGASAVESTTQSRFTSAADRQGSAPTRRPAHCKRWSRSSSETRARAQSEEMIWVARKCRSANVDFPQPAGPQSTTIDGLRRRSGFLCSALGGLFRGSIVVMTSSKPLGLRFK